MLNDGARIDLVTRMRTMSRVLESLRPESPSAVEEAVEVALEVVGRGELADAIVLLEKGVQANPFWLRGYMLLATIYEYVKKAELAVATRAGHVCRQPSPVPSEGWGEMLERVNGPVVHNRIRNTTEQLRQYERMLRENSFGDAADSPRLLRRSDYTMARPQ